MNLVIKTTAFVLLIMCKSYLADPEALSQNYGSQQDKIFIDKTKPWIQSHKLLSATQACTKKFRPNHDIKQHAKKNPYFIDIDYTFDIIPKRGDSTHKLRVNRAIIEKSDQTLYQDQIHEGIYDQKQKENIEVIFQSFADDTGYQTTNQHDHADVKANSELERNKSSHALNTADKEFIDNSTLMVRIADIFGPPPTDSNNLHFKRDTGEKNYQGSLQAAIYNNFGPEVLKTSDTIAEAGSTISTVEDDGDTANNSGLRDRYPPLSEMEDSFAPTRKTETAHTSGPAQSTPDSVQISRSRPHPRYPDSSANWTSPPSKTEMVPAPPPASSPSLLSSPRLSDVDDSPSSTSSVSTAPSQNGARAQKANLKLLNFGLYCFCLMAALVASL